MEDGTADALEPAAPAAAARERGRAVLAITVVLATVSTAALVTAQSVALPDDSMVSAAEYLPPDGDAAVYDLVNGGGETVLVQEIQRIVGFNAITSLPDGMGVEVLSLYPDDDLSTRAFWRATARQLRDGLVGPQTFDLFTADDRGVQRIASFGGSFPSVYDPPLVVIPDDPTIGERWTATGSALLGGALAYDYSAVVDDIDDECIVVASQLDFDFEGTPFIALTSTERWCRSVGLVGAKVEFDQGTGPELIEYARVDDPQSLLARESRPEAPTAVDGGDPGGWTITRVTPTLREPFFGEMLIDGITALPPATGADGLLVVAFANGFDLIGFRVGSPADGTDAGLVPLVEQWRAHPGGDPLAMAVLDDLVVVATAKRRLAAYDLNGVRRWGLDTDDLVLQPPVRVDGAVDVIVVHDLSGGVTAVDVDDGSVRWRERTRTDSDLAPAALGDLVVVADRSGDLFAIEAASGRRGWEHEQEGIAALGVVAGLVVVARDDGTVAAFDLAGVERWSSEVEVWQGRIDEVAGQPAVIGSDEVVVLDPDTGAVRWSTPVTEWADGWTGGLAVHDRSRLCVYDRNGGQTSCWPYADEGSAVRIYVAATDEGLWSLDGGLAIARIAPTAAVPGS